MSVNAKKISMLMVCATVLVAGMFVVTKYGIQNSVAAEPMADSVMAIVNGQEITKSEAENFAKYVMNVSSEEVNDKILKDAAEELVSVKSLYSFPKSLDVQSLEEFKIQDYYKKAGLIFGFMAKEKIDQPIDQTIIEGEYKTYAEEVSKEEEVKARHILFEETDEAAAKDAIKRLEDGEDFAELAKELSTGPSGPSGGDLGYFTKGRMVPEFSEAAFSTKPGEFTKKPVKTQFGWHVILVEEKRKVQPQPLEALEAQIKQKIQQEMVAELKDTINATAKVEYNKTYFTEE